MSDEKPTAPAGVVQRPMNWDKAISVAYLRCLGQPQSVTAEAVGVSERTIQAWEASPWWPDAVREAHGRWLSGVTEKAKRALAIALDSNDAQSARWVLERMLSDMAPPKQRTEHTGADGKAAEFVVKFIKPGDKGEPEK